MDVIAGRAVRAASILWRPAHGGFMLTVVCKATYALSPGESPLADEQEYINEDDNYWNDDPARSVYSPSDLAPFKLRADVMLVGHAFAPRGEPARSVSARLLVADIDKTIEIFGDRAWLYDRTLHEGPRFAKMPLRYERAAGGPDTSNPVGIRADVRDAYGSAPIPNLQPGGRYLKGPEDTFGPINFGPVAPSWLERQEKLGRHATSWSAVAWNARPLPDDLDPTFFNAAPRDQQIPELRESERLVLENLHPAHPQLVTNLSGARPYAFVERPGAAPQELALKPDTLWIDTDRSICTLTFRAQIKVDSPTAAGRVLIAMARPGERLTWDDVRSVGDAQAAPAAEEAAELTADALTDADEEADDTALHSKSPVETLIPFASPASRGAAPAWLAQSAAGGTSPGTKPPSVPAPPMQLPAPNAPPLPAPSALPALATPTFAPPLRHAAPVMPAPTPPPRTAPAPVSTPGSAPASVRAPLPVPAPVALPVPAPAPAPVPAPAPRSPARDVIDLIGYDPAFVDRIRDEPKWRDLLASLASKPSAEVRASALKTHDKDRAAEDQRDVYGVLTRAPALDVDGLDAALAASVADDGAFARPLVVLYGDLTFTFDEVEALKAAVTAATPHSAGDTKLREAIDSANELLKAPGIRGSSGAAESLAARVREAFAQSNRALPASYLDAMTERALLAERHYQRRTLFGAPWIRGALTLVASALAIPSYLPEILSRNLPMFRSMRVRVVAEAQLPLDQQETCPIALRVVALGRIAPLAPLKAPMAAKP